MRCRTLLNCHCHVSAIDILDDCLFPVHSFLFFFLYLFLLLGLYQCLGANLLRELALSFDTLLFCYLVCGEPLARLWLLHWYPVILKDA